MSSKFMAAATTLVFSLAVIGAESSDAPHVRVTYDGISAEQAAAIANVISAARDVYSREFAADMPGTIVCRVQCGPGHEMRLFNDGKDSVTLSMPSADKLARPAKSGAFVLYGLCHELGHLAMYRVLTERDWMTGAAAEGWAHYAGSVVVDFVFKDKGERAWSDPYDYRADGTARLEKQLAGASASDVVRAAGKWKELEKIVGRKEVVRAFAAWQAAKVDLAAPSPALLTAAVTAAPSKKDALTEWWTAAAPLFVESRPASGFKKVQTDPSKLTGRPVSIAKDDGTAEGRKSIAGGGHARLFEAPGPGQWYLRSVSIFGSRYGPRDAPAGADFEIALCDSEMRPITSWKKPYNVFDRGESKWVKVDVPPTLVPTKFYVCAVFRPTASSGVFVSFDDSTHGDSRIATPGKLGEEFKQGDWMIRVEVDQPKSADALRGQ
jgi:hypothetical protein